MAEFFHVASRPLHRFSGELEAAILKVPGQKVACIRTRIEGPSYCNPRNARRWDAPHNGYGAGGVWRDVSRGHSRRRIPDVRILSQGHLRRIFSPRTSAQALPGRDELLVHVLQGCRIGPLGRSLAAQPGLRCATGNLDSVASLRDSPRARNRF